MNETALVVLAAAVAAGMASLIRAGASASLRAAIRTSVVLFLGWLLAYRAYGPLSWSSLGARIRLMLAFSAIAFGLAWGLYFRDTRLAKPSLMAAVDRINVFIAAGFAILLILGSAPQRYAFAVMLVSGAIVLASKRG